MATAHNGSIPRELGLKLGQLEARIRRLALVRGLGILGMVLAAGIGLGVLLDLKWELGVGLRAGLLAVVGGAACWVVYRYLLRPCFVRLSPAELAAVVEASHPELRERLTSTVELNDPHGEGDATASALMRELLLEETLSGASKVNFVESVSPTRARRSSVLGAVAVAALMTPFLFSPSGYRLLWQRFFSPWGNFASGSNLYFEVDGGDRVVARGTNHKITAAPQWRRAAEERPESVWLNWSDDSGERDARHMDYDEEAGVYFTTIPHVFVPFDFDISSGRARTRQFHVDVQDAPAVVAATLEIQPPAYTGMNARRRDGVVGEIPAFAGSGLTFELEFNKPVQTAELAWAAAANAPAEEEQPAPAEAHAFALAPDRLSARLEMTATRGGRFEFRLRDRHGLPNPGEPRRVLVITPDEAPLIEVAGNVPRRARPGESVPIEALATDDLGVAELELHLSTLAGEERITAAPEQILGGRSVPHRFEIDLSALNVPEGEVITWRIRAADERPIPGPNETWTEPRTIAVTGQVRPLDPEEIARRQNEMKETLEAIREDLQQNREEVAELEKQAEEALREQKPFRKPEQLPQFGQTQFELARRLEALAQRFAEHPLYNKLAPPAQEVSRRDLPEASRTIRKSAELLPQQRLEGMKQNVEQLTRAERKLDELAGQFDQLAALEDDLLELNRMAAEAENLAQELAQLEQQLNNAPADETPEQQAERRQQAAQEQQATQQEQEQLQKELEELMERRPELADAARQQQLDRLGEVARRLSQLIEPQDTLAEALQEEAEQSPDTPPTPPETDPQQPNPQAEPVRRAQTQQEQVARDATQLALDIARQLGTDDPAAQQAMNMAKECFT